MKPSLAALLQMTDQVMDVDIMQTSKKVMFKFLCFVMACSVIGLASCCNKKIP